MTMIFPTTWTIQLWKIDGHSRSSRTYLGNSHDQLAAISELDRATLQSALLRLIDHSLVQVAGDLDAPRYRLHRLTETFLLHEVLTWQPPSN
jgi:hypothetical protein